MKNLFAHSRIVAAITFSEQNQAIPVASALLEAGITTLEIVLRTPCALQCLKAIRKHFPEALVGGGTIIHPDQVMQCQQAGAKFIVSPGISSKIIEAAQVAKIPILPGVATASEIIHGLQQGIQTMKLFPANLAGGVKALQTFGAVFPEVSFCPTGGINQTNAREFYQLPNVIAVGGSWLTPPDLLQTQNWQAIFELAKASLAALE